MMDSRGVLDNNGAEKLLGRGDMLFLEISRLERIHGAFVSDEEARRVVEFWTQQAKPEFDDTILSQPDSEDGDEHGASHPADPLYDEAIQLVAQTRQASISMIQRRLMIGYNRAARMVERMEQDGMVGPPMGSKPREVLLPPVI